MAVKRRLSTSAIVLLVIAVFMLFTCPKTVEHETELSRLLSAVWHEKCRDMNQDSEGAVSWLGNTLGGMLGDGIIPSIVKSNMEVKDFFLVSVGYWCSGGEKTPVTIGLFNHVFCLASKEQIAEQLNFE